MRVLTECWRQFNPAEAAPAEQRVQPPADGPAEPHQPELPKPKPPEPALLDAQPSDEPPAQPAPEPPAAALPVAAPAPTTKQGRVSRNWGRSELYCYTNALLYLYTTVLLHYLYYLY